MKLTVIAVVFAALCAVALCNRVQYSLPGFDELSAGEWEIVGRADPSVITTFRLALYQRNLDKLETLFWKISDPKDEAYMQYMAPSEVKALVSPPRVVQDRVVTWAFSQGAEAAESFGDWVEVRASVRAIEAMLQCELHMVRDLVTDATELKIVSGSYSLPNEIASAVEFVQNLNQFIHARHIGTYGGKADPVSFSDTNASEDEVIPETLYTLYDIDYTITTNSSQCVAEFSTFAYLESDMTEFCQGVDIQQPLPITNVGPFNDNFADAECTLDIQYINAVGLNGTSFFWTTKGWILDLAQELLAYTDTPQVVSISWSSDERSDGQAYNFRSDAEIMQLGLVGTSVLAASGDSGAVGTSHCTGNRYPLNPGYPTTSPYVTSVGATMLVGQPTKYTGPASVCQEREFTCAVDGTEDPADENFGGYATGGGFSVYESRPQYQDAVVSEYLNDNTIPKPPPSYYNATNRGFPDVAANGYNLIMRQNSKWVIVGGTSASTPIWGGIYAIMNDHLAMNGKPPIGFANPLLYQMFADGQGTFLNIGNLQTNNDDGCGSELGYTSNPNGWDPVCGLGTPNVANILSYLDKMMPTLPDRR